MDHSSWNLPPSEHSAFTRQGHHEEAAEVRPRIRSHALLRALLASRVSFSC
jgi:hypothetical protein